MQQINLKIEDNYLEQAMNVLNTLPKNKVEVVRVVTNKSAFSLLKGKITDPMKWQQDIRSASDTNLYGDK